MTRKKSNVKALALAVTCAILAGGYSGLNPVYAAGDYGDYTVKYDATDNSLDYVTKNSAGGYNTVGIYKIKLNNIVLDSSNGASPSITVGSYFSIDGSNGSISAADGKFTVSGAGAITASSLKLDGMTNDVKTAIKTNETNITDNKNNINTLKNDKADAANVYTKTDSDSKFAGKTYEGKVNALETTVGNDSSGLVKKVGDLEGKTTNISYDASTNTTIVNGIKFHTDASSSISDINDGIIRFSKNGAKDIVQINSDLMFNDNASGQAATLTLEGVKTLNGLSNGGSVIQAGNGSVVGGVTFDNKDITNINNATVDNILKVKTIQSIDGNNEITVEEMATTKSNTAKITYEGGATYINQGDDQQVVIDGKGLKVGKNSSRMNDITGFATSKNLYVGTADADNPTKDNSKFYVDGATGETVVKGTSGTTTIYDGAITIDEPITPGSSSESIQLSKGTVVASASVISPKFFVDPNNAFEKNSLKVGDGTKGVTIADGEITTTGDATVGGKLDVTGNITGADITANGALKGKTLGIGATGNEFKVDADGAVKAAGGKVTIDKDGNAQFGDTGANITKIQGNKITTGYIQTDDNIESSIGGVKMQNGKITASNMEITGAISLNDLTVNNKLTVGAFSVDKNGVVAGVKSINGANVTASGTGLKIGSATVGDANPFSSTGFTVDATGNVAAKDITAGTYNGNTIGTDNRFNGVELKGGNVAATKVTADTITDGTATMTGGTVTANTITANTSASLAGVTFDASGVDFNGKDIKNVANVTATTAKLGNLSVAGHVIKNEVEAGGPIGLGTTVTVNNAGELGGITKIDGVNVTDNAGGLAIGTGATQVTIGGANAISVGTGTFTVDGAGLVTGNQFTTTNGSYLKDNELKLNAANIWNTTEGIKAEKAVIGGVNTLDNQGIDTSGKLHVGGQATFGDSTSGNYTTVNGGKVDITANGGTTTIEGAKITTKTLDVEDIILRNEMKDGNTGTTINIKGSDGSMSVASGAFAVDKEGQLTNKITGTAGGFGYETNLETSKSGIKANYTNAINGNQNTIDMGASGISIGVADATASVGAGFKAELEKATMGYGTANSIVVSADTIKSALGTDVTRVMTNSATDKSIVDKVGTASRSLKADEIIDVAGGMTITTNNTGTTFSDGTTNTLIKGSAITSTNGTATGVLNGSSLKLDDGTGANSTALNAGGATFTGAAGEKGGKVTTINGGTITTDTLNVERINLGGEVIDKGAAGVEANSKLYMDAQGNFRAAGGNFKVTGADGAMTNTVGNTTLKTDNAGASMKYNNGTVESNVSVGDNSAMISAGASSIEVKNDGITNNGKTTFKGAVDATVPTTETTINGNTITTGHLITDRLTITGSGAAAGAGTGTIALGGDGSITSNIKDAATGKEATFKTNAEGTFTHAKDGTNETTNTVNAQGNTNEVTDGTNTSTATQKATSIGGVVTNGTVTMKQELTADGVKFEQTGHDEVNIAKGDVTVKNNRNAATPGQEVHLSDLGSLNNLDGELAARDEYQDNKTAVGAINAEAGIRREEVARLDNRIDDVNNRVDKVGAMAAAIASLKSIGYDPQAPSEFSIGLGQYKGETGVAMGFFHYPNKNFMINVSLSTAGGETMGGIGATWRFGHKSPQKLLDEQREAQARKELAAAEKYQAAAKLAKEAQERAEYAAKLARQAQVSADNAKAAADATQAKHFQ